MKARVLLDFLLSPFLLLLVISMAWTLHQKNSEIAMLEEKLVDSEYKGEARQFLASVPVNPGSPSREVQQVTVTAYNPTPEQTDGDPLMAASMRKVRPGTVAVSRDLFDQGWVFGKKVRIEGLGIFEINDLMHPRMTKRVDVFMWDEKQAQAFGKKRVKVALLHI